MGRPGSTGLGSDGFYDCRACSPDGCFYKLEFKSRLGLLGRSGYLTVSRSCKRGLGLPCRGLGLIEGRFGAHPCKKSTAVSTHWGVLLWLVHRILGLGLVYEVGLAVGIWLFPYFGGPSGFKRGSRLLSRGLGLI